MARPQVAGEGDSLYIATNIALAAGDKLSMLETSTLLTVRLQYNGMKSYLLG
jgi:hypothetical protein